MKNIDSWKPGKYIYRKGKLIASREPKEVAISSRLITDLIAKFYHENLHLHAKGKLLDLGCGKVPLYAAYKDYVSDIICVDWGNTLHKNEHLDFECDLNKNLPFKDREFNTIVLSDVLEHIPQPENLWLEMKRILSINGKIIMNVPFYYWIHEQPYDYYRYTEFALRRFVENAGLKLILLEPIGGVPEILADIYSKYFLSLPIFGSWISYIIQICSKVFIKTPIGKRISNKTRQSFPYGYIMVIEKI
jgi:ubiquinone/menaquinone biosynthesis C-methylase UbiE